MLIKIFLCGLIMFLLGIITGGMMIFTLLMKKISSINALNEEYNEIMCIQNLWMEKVENGQRITDLLKQKEYSVVAIHGIGMLGVRLLNQIRQTDIEVRYIIGERKDSIYRDIPVKELSPDLEPVDVIIVTSSYYYYEIEKRIKSYLSYEVISIERLIK